MMDDMFGEDSVVGLLNDLLNEVLRTSKVIHNKNALKCKRNICTST